MRQEQLEIYSNQPTNLDFVFIITPQTVASLQNLVNKHTLEVPPVFNELTGENLT